MELDTRVNNLKEVIRKTPYDLLQERVYTCTANSCLLLTAYKHKKGAKGWSRLLVDDDGQPMLTYKQQEMLEQAFEKAPWISEALQSEEEEENQWEMVGGAPLPKLSSGGMIVKNLTPFLPNADDLSLDKMLNAFLKKSDEMDEFWGRFAYNSPGFSKLLNTYVDIPKVPFPVPARPLVSFLVLLVDSIRLSVGLAGYNSAALSFLVLLEELVTGQWRQMLLTSLAFISPTGMAAGVILKYIVNAWTLINPELRDQIFKDMLKGGKSLFVGFLLWAAANLPPQVVKNQIEAAIAKARQMVEGVDSKVKELEEKSSAALKPLGKKIQFTGLNLDRLTKISLQDIQNLQALAQWDLLVCSSEFQSIVKLITKEPILRFIIELFNIPTLPEDTYKLCGPQPYPTVAEKMKVAFQPQVVDTGEPTAADVAEAVKEEAKAEKKEEAPTEETPTESKKEEAVTEETPTESKKEEAPKEEETEEVPKEESTDPKEVPPPVKGGRRKGFKLRAKSVKGRRGTPRRATRRRA
jgi:hypothetical protein